VRGRLFRIMLAQTQNQAKFCGRIVAGIYVPINAVTWAATDSFSPCRS
jgi:hypothetical protein